MCAKVRHQVFGLAWGWEFLSRLQISEENVRQCMEEGKKKRKEKQEEQIARSRTVIRGECCPRACDEGAR